MTTKLRFALYGVLAALAGTGVGHLVAALTEPAASPVLAVGGLVIDHTPTPVKNWAIAHFGTHDKTILVGSVLVGVLVLAAVAGLLARRAFRLGAGLLVLLVGVALYAALSRPVVSATDALPGVATGLVGLAVLAGASPGPSARDRSSPVPISARAPVAVPPFSAPPVSPPSPRPAGMPVA